MSARDGKPAARKRAGGAGPKARRKDPRDQLLVWRGYVLVAVGAGAIAATASWWFGRQGDLVTAGLFTITLFLLMLVALVAMGRVRRLRAEVERGAR